MRRTVQTRKLTRPHSAADRFSTGSGIDTSTADLMPHEHAPTSVFDRRMSMHSSMIDLSHIHEILPNSWITPTVSCTSILSGPGPQSATTLGTNSLTSLGNDFVKLSDHLRSASHQWYIKSVPFEAAPRARRTGDFGRPLHSSSESVVARNGSFVPANSGNSLYDWAPSLTIAYRGSRAVYQDDDTANQILRSTLGPKHRVARRSSNLGTTRPI
jgi:hypothetical protein